MKKGNGLQDLKDFKKQLYFNAGVHIIVLIIFLTILYTNIFVDIPFIILNLYCIMLQRYNYIRINQVINKHKIFEEKKVNLIKTELKEKDSLLKEHVYTLECIGKKKEIKTLDELLENAPIERLKQIKKLLEDISEQEKTYDFCPDLIYSATFFLKKKTKTIV